MDLYIAPTIGTVPGAALTAADVARVFTIMRDAGRAPRTITQARAVLSNVLQRAVNEGLLPSNPARALKPPRTDRPQLNVPSVDELSRLLERARGTQWEIPLLLSGTTGARRGEVLALRWTDYSLKTGRVSITRTLQAVDGSLIEVEPKTDRARRLVTLPAFVRERLEQHREAQGAL